MKRVLTAAVLIPLVLLAVFRAPGWLFSALCGVVALGVTWEFLGIVKAYQLRTFPKITLSIVVLTFTLTAVSQAFDTDRSAFVVAYIGCIFFLSLWATFLYLVMALS